MGSSHLSSQPHRTLRSGGCSLRSAWIKKSPRDPISTEKDWTWWHMPVTAPAAGSIKWEDHGPGSLGKRETLAPK
jgi:hypothetical protein